MSESERFLFFKYMEDHYKEMVKQYEEEYQGYHIAMTFQKLPLAEEFKDSMTGLFFEYLTNLAVINSYSKDYKGSKLTMEELDYLKDLILRSMFRVFDMANKDKYHGGNLAYQMENLYKLFKANDEFLKIDFIDIGFDNDGFFYYVIT